MTITEVAVVVPAHNEEALLPMCLDALGEAVAAVRSCRGVSVDVLVVLDRCVDGTAAVVASRPWARGLAVAAGTVGGARAAGFADVLRRRPARSLAGLWLATTDADSRVPRDWLVRQLSLADGGADLVLGTVDVEDWTQHPAHVETTWRAAYQAADGHPHVHGANVGLRAEAYRQVGGFAALASDEDVALAAALAHRRVVRTGGIPVVTSARRDARAPAGFARHLAGMSAREPGSVRRKPELGVDQAGVDVQLEVQVAAGGVARGPDGADHLAGADALADPGPEPRLVVVRGGEQDSVDHSVGDDGAPAVRAVPPGGRHDAVPGGADGCPAGSTEVGARVQLVHAGDRVHPHAVRRGQPIMSASLNWTACRSLSVPPKASRSVAWRVAHSNAPSAKPSARAPIEIRPPYSVCMNVRNP
jgi:hypothetical protein